MTSGGKVMDFVHKRMHLEIGDTVVVQCSQQCNVLMTSDGNFSKYKRGIGFDHYGGGGFFEKFPAKLVAPNSGFWNITIDLGGGGANIKHSITVIHARSNSYC